jgi:hypothetical protein
VAQSALQCRTLLLKAIKLFSNEFSNFFKVTVLNNLQITGKNKHQMIQTSETAFLHVMYFYISCCSHCTLRWHVPLLY